MLPNTLHIDTYELKVESATFRYITDSISGPGWDFVFRASCQDAECEEMSSNGVILRTEAAPLPLAKVDDLTGVRVVAALPYDDDSGEPLFGLVVGEEHEVANLEMHFRQRDGKRYLIEIHAEVARTVLGHAVPLHLLAWAEQLPNHAYPV